MEFRYSMQLAQKVLDRLLQHPEAADVDASIGAYQNGREHGYSIIRYQTTSKDSDTAVCFAQFRNTDDIVVYTGDPSDTAVSVDAYVNKRFFRPEHLDDAVEFILAFLKRKPAPAEVSLDRHL